MLKEINLKDVGSVNASIAITKMEIDSASRDGVTVLKLLHGYGSHGYGGVILKEVRRELAYLKRLHKIKDFFNGDKWNIFNEEIIEILIGFHCPKIIIAKARKPNPATPVEAFLCTESDWVETFTSIEYFSPCALLNVIVLLALRSISR